MRVIYGWRLLWAAPPPAFAMILYAPSAVVYVGTTQVAVFKEVHTPPPPLISASCQCTGISFVVSV